MERLFAQQLARLPYAVGLALAVLAMPGNVFAYNQQGVGISHDAPWLTRSCASIARTIDAAMGLGARCMAVLRSPGMRMALPAAVILLAVTGYLDTDSGSVMFSLTVPELFDKKKGLVAEARSIFDRVYKDQNGEWRGDDTKKYDDLLAQAETIQQEIDRSTRLSDAERAIESVGESRGRQTTHNPAETRNAPARGSMSRTEAPSTEDRALAMHGWFAAGSLEGDDVITERHRQAAQRCGIRLDQSKLRLRLPAVALRSMNPNDIKEWEQRLTQVDVVSPDLGGHYTVPDEMMRPLEIALLQHGGMRQVSTIIRTATGAELPNPTMNDTSNEGAELGEGLEHAELDTEFNQLLLHAYKYTSKRVPVSVEFLQDNAVNFVGRIGSILGERIGRITNRRFTTGSGNAQPNGIVTAATSSGVTTASATAITYDEIIDLKHSVDPAYRSQGARFMFNDTTLKLLKKIKVPQYSGDTAGQPLWRAGLAASEPDTIDGDPYTINQHMANPTANNKAMLYGLLSKYLIRDVRDVTLVRLDERYAELGVVAFLAFSRHDGDLLDAGTHPVKYLTMHS